MTVRVTNINEAPTEAELTGTTVAENTPGAAIGTVTATDPDIVDKLHYLVSDSRFEVVNGTLKLKSGVSLDYETEPTIHITITTRRCGRPPSCAARLHDHSHGHERRAEPGDALQQHRL